LASAVLAGLLLTSPILGQQDVARQHIQTGLDLAARGDTAAALREFYDAIEADSDLADAHFYYGRFLARIASALESDYPTRQRAEKAIREAIERDPNNPLYLTELGMLLIRKGLRNDGERVLSRALDKAQQPGDQDPALLAETYFSLGWAQEFRWENQRSRRFNGVLGGSIMRRMPATQRLSRYVENYLNMHPEIVGFGSGTRERMMEYYRTALEFQPDHWETLRRVLLHTFDASDFDEYLAVAKRLKAAYPDRTESHLYEGLGLHAMGREDEAGAAFDRALSMMSEWEREPFLNIESIMRSDMASAYLSLRGEELAAFEQNYWTFSDPLFLTEANERRLEHFSRVAYADLRFSEPSTGHPGWATDRGLIYIRYGKPDLLSTFRARHTVTRVWYYGGGVVFMFTQQAGYFHSRFSGNYEFIANDIREAQPAKYDNIPSVPALFPVEVQIARFRGESPEWVAVEIHAEFPFEALLLEQDMQSSEIETGLFLFNTRGDKIVRQSRSQVIEFGDAVATNPIRSWRLMMPPAGKLVAGVEARDALSWYAAASRDTFTVELFPDDQLAISDLLLADNVRPLAEEPESRADFEITPNPSLTYVPLQPVHLYYEVYGLEQDREAIAAFEVRLTVRVARLDRGGGFAQILGDIADAWGFSIAGDDRVELRFARQVDLSQLDRVTEYLSLDLQKAPPGDYEITVQIWDQLAQQLATRQRMFRVIRGE
jgi:GWxTD domain-containing protein